MVHHAQNMNCIFCNESQKTGDKLIKWEWNESGFRPPLCTYRLNWARRTSWGWVRWLRWHCPPDTGFEIRALAVWGRARYLSVTEAPHNTDFHTWMGKKHFCFFQTAETGNRTPNSGVKGSGANHYPRAPPPHLLKPHPKVIHIIVNNSKTNVEHKELAKHNTKWFFCSQLCF